ncbi:uncharacterized protein LOC142168006 [Nicotiana tabacum]|uniref:Uncharacterized protein LOC142168006 n=1 Tax=Nicotiana tabacum TaxID=4097 RepID=A0AC58SIF9_TOBAC
MALVSEGKIIIDMDEIAEANHASVAPKEKKCSRLQNMSSNAFLQFRSFEPVEVDLPRKTLEGSLELDNHSKDNDDESWTLVTRKKQKHQAVLRLRIPKPRAMMSNVDKLQLPRIIKSSISKKINDALLPKFRKPITLHECFPRKFLHRGHVGATHVVSSTDETKESNDELAPMKTQEYHDNGKVVTCCATISFTDDDLLLGSKPHNRPLFVIGAIREQQLNRILVDDGSAVNIRSKMVLKKLGIFIDELSKNAKTSYNLLLGRPWIHENEVVSSTLHQCLKYRRDGEIVKIDADINPFTETESYFADAKFYLDSCEPSVEKPSSIDKVDTKTDKEHLVFCYVPCEHRKKGQPLLQECTPKKEISHKDIRHLKEHMTIPVAQIPFVTCESTKGNLQANKIKGYFDPKAFILLEKSGYDFSNPSRLGELKDEVIGKKIHGLTESQMRLIKQGHYVTIPTFGLGFSLAEPLRISSKRGKEIASSQHTSAGETKEVKDKKIKQRASVFDRIGGSTPRALVFERLGHKSEHISPKHLKGVAAISKTSFFCLLGTTKKPSSRNILSKHDEQGHCDVADKEICSAFPSRMKRKSILSISTDGPLKVKISTIVYTCQPHRETNKEEGAMSTIQGSQREKLDFVEISHHITVEDNPCLEVNDEVHEAPPQLEDGEQSTVDELKELNLGTLEDPRLTFISALLTTQEEEEYFKLLTKYKDVFAWTYKEMPGLSPKAFLKDDFLLPIIELMFDVTTWHEAMSFMDGSSGYNQIRMSLKDEECTTFRTPKGIYCYKVMPFGLKNAGATYQRAMQNIFDHMLHRRVECYVDDLVVKTNHRHYHLEDLQIVFERLRKFDLKMNPLKCAFGVTSGKFLGFIVCHHGNEVYPTKIDAIQKMPELKNLRELHSLQGNLAFIRRSDSEAIDTLERSLGALLAQENEEGKEQSLYYLSRTLVGAKLNYTPFEKICLALLCVIKKLRHYFEAYTIKLISRADPVKFVMTRPIVSGCLARWSIFFNQYEITYIPQQVVKGQALANFLVDHPLSAEWELSDEFPNEDVLFIEELPPWTMFFDASARHNGAGAGVVLISPERQVLPFCFVLGERCSNNAAEYQALIVDLEMALDMKNLQLEIYNDSKPIINQLLGSYDVKKEDLLPYHF